MEAASQQKVSSRQTGPCPGSSVTLGRLHTPTLRGAGTAAAAGTASPAPTPRPRLAAASRLLPPLSLPSLAWRVHQGAAATLLSDGGRLTAAGWLGGRLAAARWVTRRRPRLRRGA